MSRRRPIVLSVEQALSMPYATLRLVHLGYRVIRVEPTPGKGRAASGDPNRSIGRPVDGDPLLCSYFVAPNVGKEAIALNLKAPAGRELLHRLARDLGVDVFCTNTMPQRHAGLGIDHASLRRVLPDVIWCSISAMGLAHPDVPGYDPVIQALCGYMDLTGYADGPPLQCGLPIIDLKAGDEAFAQVILALFDRAETGKGREIDVSMAQVAVSWLQTFLPMLELGSPPEELRRSGNEHRQFIPTNAYRTADGFVFVAIGSDVQWARLTSQPMFASLAQARWATNEGRRHDRAELHAAIEAITRGHPSEEAAFAFAAAEVPHAPITTISEVLDLPFVAPNLLETVTPDGRTIRLPPPAVLTAHLAGTDGRLPFAPRYGEHTDAVLSEVGLAPSDIAELRAQQVIA